MVALIIGMLICVGLAVAVLGLVAIPARREGRDLLTPRGEEVMTLARERTQSTMERTGEALSTTRERVADRVSETVSAAVRRPEDDELPDDAPAARRAS